MQGKERLFYQPAFGGELCTICNKQWPKKYQPILSNQIKY